MNTFALIKHLPKLSGPFVQYYSLVLGEEDRPSELEDFLQRHNNPEHIEELKPLYALLKKMAFRHGARQEFFRDERKALALPPDWRNARMIPREIRESFQEVGHLRLYAVRLNSRIVFLLNGGKKTTGIDSAQDCPVVGKYFLQAQRIAQALDEARIAGFIEYNDDESDIIFEPEIYIR